MKPFKPSWYFWMMIFIYWLNILLHIFPVCLFFLTFIHFWDSASGGGQSKRETQNPKQAPGSKLSSQSPMRGSNLRTMRSWPKPKSEAQPTEPPRCLWFFCLLIHYSNFCLSDNMSISCILQIWWHSVAFDRYFLGILFISVGLAVMPIWFLFVFVSSFLFVLV